MTPTASMRWKEISSEQYCDSVRDGTHDSPKFLDAGFPLITSKNIKMGQIIFDSANLISESDFKEINRRSKVDQWDVLFSMIGTVGEVCLVHDEEPSFAIKNIGLFKSGDELKGKWLYYSLTNPITKAAIKQAHRGASQQYIPLGELRKLPIRVPTNQDVMHRVVSVLSAYDDLIENNRRRMALLEESARLLYREWFVRLRFPGYEHTHITDGVPEGWERKTLGDLCSEIRESVLPDTLEPDTPYMGLEHMPRRSISLNDWGKVEQVTSSKHQFKAGEILFGKIRPYFHKVGVAFVDGVASSDAIVIRPVEEKLHGLVLMTVSSDEFVAVTSQTMKEGSKMPRADWKQMQTYSVPLPPSGLLSTFDGVIQPIIAQLKALAFANQKLRAARDLLLPRLMSGEIAV